MTQAHNPTINLINGPATKPRICGWFLGFVLVLGGVGVAFPHGDLFLWPAATGVMVFCGLIQRLWVLFVCGLCFEVMGWVALVVGWLGCQLGGWVVDFDK